LSKFAEMLTIDKRYGEKMTNDPFWVNVDACLDSLATARTSDAVISILSNHFPERSAGDAFFGGSGGDRQLWDSLKLAGWTKVWAEASYHYVAKSSAGELITYIEGDVYRGDRR
jgi:hypothetical protein